jgi:hypothetical protein
MQASNRTGNGRRLLQVIAIEVAVVVALLAMWWHAG